MRCNASWTRPYFSPLVPELSHTPYYQCRMTLHSGTWMELGKMGRQDWSSRRSLEYEWRGVGASK